LCDRGDGMGISLLRQRNIDLLVLSTEKNPVVQARCKKLRIECVQGLDDKVTALRSFCAGRNIRLDRTIYLGNDINDLECLRAVGWGVAVADSDTRVLAQADQVLTHRGGFGAARELCNLILERLTER
jgi:YrbI family 3-deoxy-D-manno-octulosonate 8-phosphate phosphatase